MIACAKVSSNRRQTKARVYLGVNGGTLSRLTFYSIHPSLRASSLRGREWGRERERGRERLSRYGIILKKKKKVPLSGRFKRHIQTYTKRTQKSCLFFYFQILVVLAGKWRHEFGNQNYTVLH